jgi:hypothetical protein
MLPVNDLAAVAARLRDSRTIAELLDAAFDAFEFIRLVARACEDRVPELFAAFMLAAGTAVEGRNAINNALGASPPSGAAVNPAADTSRVADQLAALACLLSHRLSQAASEADGRGDRAACNNAARAAMQIYQLLTQTPDETRTW